MCSYVLSLIYLSFKAKTETIHSYIVKKEKKIRKKKEKKIPEEQMHITSTEL